MLFRSRLALMFCAWLAVTGMTVVALAQRPGEEIELPNNEDALIEAVGSTVDIALASGDILSNVKLAGIDRHTKTREILSLRVQRDSDKKPVKLARKLFDQAAKEGKPLLPRAADSAPTASAGAKAKPVVSAKIKKAEAQVKLRAEKQQQWLERLGERNVKPWPELTPERKLAAAWEQNQFVVQVDELFPDLIRYDTGKFIFCSNLPPQQAKVCVVYLDDMHQKLCDVYGVDDPGSVWLGKGLVFAFMRKEEFGLFEERIMNGSTGGAMGLCHSYSDGRVVISCYCGHDADFFGQMMVHETSHGLIHRYKTGKHIPSWINEGMADWIGNLIVPKATAARSKVSQTVARVRSRGAIGGDFFRNEGNIEFDDYGLAVSMVDFLLKNDPKKFVEFIEGIKAGLTWQESLKESYNLTPQEFVSAYGRAIGAPNLRI
jgi:hypothetical protein